MRRSIIGACALCLIGLACSSSSRAPLEPTPLPAVPAPVPGPAPGPSTGMTATLVGAGDIANCASRSHERTAAILDRVDGTVITMGDNVYPDGAIGEFLSCYDKSWGRHKNRTKPAPGDHEYRTPGAAGYFEYFSGQIGQPGLGYYSYFAGDWQVFSLDSSAPASANSPQYRWLQSELQSTTVRCRLAYWHLPVFNSGFDGNRPQMREVWRLLFAHGVDVVLAGHAHDYERFSRLDADGVPDRARGIRQFIVGTGGASFTEPAQRQASSEAFASNVLGVLKLTLEPQGYKWQFIPADGWTFSDAGSDECS